MKTALLNNFRPLNVIEEFAMKNYNTYVEHYKNRNLTPMPLEEFLKNYMD